MVGKSTVTVNGKGEIERIVTVIALHIQREDSKELLVQIAKKKGNVFEPSCQLPGGKQSRGELTGESARKWLANKLSPLVDCVQARRLEQKVEIKESKEYGVRTKYLRTICFCDLTASGHWFSSASPDGALPMQPLSPSSGNGLRCSERGEMSPMGLSPMSGWYTPNGTGRHGLRQRSDNVFNHQVANSDDAKLYAWVSPAEFEFLSSAAGEEELRAWVSFLSSLEMLRPLTSLGRPCSPAAGVPGPKGGACCSRGTHQLGGGEDAGARADSPKDLLAAAQEHVPQMMHRSSRVGARGGVTAIAVTVTDENKLCL
jgi:hypothetical protein